MSTAAPPPFGAPQATPAPTRRSLRAHRRAVEDQARWQRNQNRLQMRAMQRRSVTGPLLLVAAGTALLLLETGRLHWTSALLWLGTWWPAILIGAGIVMLLEWGLDHWLQPGGGSPVPRRVLGGFAATVLLILAIGGAGLMAARRGARFLQTPWMQSTFDDNLRWDNLGAWGDRLGIHSDFTSELRAPLAPSGSFTIDDPRGDVTVTGVSTDGQVHVIAHQHLVSWQQDTLDRRRRDEQPRFSGDASHLTLATTLDDEDSVDLTVTLPHNASLFLHSGEGDVSVEEVRGAATINARQGDVKLTALRGTVHLSTDSEETEIIAHSLGSGLVLDGRSGDIDLSDVDGGITLRGDFFGTTQLERIHGQVTFQSSFTHLTCAGIPGSLVIDGRNDLNAHHLEGPVVLATSDRNLTLDGVQGATTITNRNGAVAVTLATPLQPLHIENANGTVEVSLPEHAAFTLHAQTANADIQTDLGLPATQAGDATTVAGPVLGGGPAIDLRTTNDDIQVNRTPASDSDSWKPQTPALQLRPSTRSKIALKP